MYLQYDKVYIASTGSGRIEVPLTGEEINSICTPGPNDMAVKYVCDKPSLRSWMSRYSKELIREEAKEYGAWSDEELANDEDTLHRIIWILAWNEFEEEDPDSHLADEEFQQLYSNR